MDAGDGEMSPDSQPAIHPSVHPSIHPSIHPPMSIDCVKRNQKSNRRERTEERTVAAGPYQTARIRSPFFALGRVPLNNLFLAICCAWVTVCLLCVSRRRQEGGFGFNTDCVNVDVDVDVKRSVGEVGKWHLPDLGF